jgi:hypothetical protein
MLCLAAVAAWVRVYFANDTLRYMYQWQGPPYTAMVNGHEVEERGFFSERQWLLASGQARVAVAVTTSDDIASDDPPGLSWQSDPPGPMGPLANTFFGRIGFQRIAVVSTMSPGQDVKTVGYVVPLWSVVIITAVLPVVSVRSWQRRRRSRIRLARGECLTCGYDLRGGPGRCPECGAAAPTTT